MRLIFVETTFRSDMSQSSWDEQGIGLNLNEKTGKKNTKWGRNLEYLHVEG